MAAEDQSDALALLHSAAAPAGDAQVIETHISLVVLGPERAFKLKRAVRLPYVDFSTPALRLAACGREVELNRRTAPAIYRGVRRITRTEDGGVELDGPGALVDAAVEMLRFDEDTLFDRRAARGALTDGDIDALAAEIASLHDTAAVDHARTGSANLAAVLDINARGFAAADLFPRPRLDGFLAAFQRALESAAPLLDARERDGAVRHCHGDLHLRNICLFDGRPTLFDCLEFDDAMATIDVLYDLAFVLMDLWHRGLRSAANRLMNRYLDARDESSGLALLPLFMAVRAAVRSHVAAARARSGETSGRDAAVAEAEGYFDLALALLRPVPPRLVAIGGHSGTGKSTVAAAVAADVGPPPGARVLSSDRRRKRMFQVDALTRLPPSAYRPEVSEAVYAGIAENATAILRSGHAVVAEAVFDRVPDRQRIEAAARAAGAGFAAIWLRAPEAVLAARVAARRADPSDATVEIVRRQAAAALAPVEWQTVDAAGTVAETIAAARSALGLDVDPEPEAAAAGSAGGAAAPAAAPYRLPEAAR